MTAALLALRNRSRMTVRGTAVTYGVPAEMNGTTEVVEAGAFTNLESDDITLVDGHDESRLLARTGAGTLRLMDGPHRLEYQAVLPGTQLGRDVYELTERGDYGGASVGMVVTDERTEIREGHLHRRILAAELIHVSPVGRPAYEQTQVEAMAATAARKELRWL